MKIRHYEFSPSEALRPYIDCYWYQGFDCDINKESPVQRCVPLGMTEIIFHLSGEDCLTQVGDKWLKLPRGFVVGVYKDAVLWKSTGTARAFGIRLKPESLMRLFKVPAACVANNYVDIDTFFGRDMSSFTHNILAETQVSQLIAVAEAFLLAQLKHAGRKMSYIAEATRLIRESKGNVTIEELGEMLSISERQLQRVFKDGIGMGPKSYLRIIRFRNVYEYLQNTGDFSWTDISYDFGYADQAHFIRDFKQFTGAVPTTMVLQSEQFPQMTGSSII